MEEESLVSPALLLPLSQILQDLLRLDAVLFGGVQIVEQVLFNHVDHCAKTV